MFENVDINRPPYSTRYPELKGYLEVDMRTNTARNNLLVNCGKGFIVDGGSQKDGCFVLDRNRAAKVDLPSGPFSLAWLKTAPLSVRMDGLEIPSGKIGLRTPKSD